MDWLSSCSSSSQSTPAWYHQGETGRQDYSVDQIISTFSSGIAGLAGDLVAVVGFMCRSEIIVGT